MSKNRTGKTPKEIEAFLLADLQENNGYVGAIDNDADYRFAAFLDDEATMGAIVQLERVSTLPIYLQLFRQFVNPLRLKRMAGLRRLVARGLVEAYWMGTGEGGEAATGHRRVRIYELCKVKGSQK